MFQLKHFKLTPSKVVLRNLISFLIFASSITYSFGQLTADFITVPSYNNNNNITVCQGSSILFVLEDQNNTNITPTTSVEWTFTGANISSSAMRTPFAVTFNSSGTAKLTLTDGGISNFFEITITATSTPPLSPSLGCASPTSVSTTITQDGTTKFTYCPNPETGSHPFVFSLDR